MNKLSKIDQEVLQLLSEGVPDHEICRQLKVTPQALSRSVQRIEARTEIETNDAGRFYERALRKRAERVNVSLNIRFRALMDILPHAVLIIDGRNGRIKDLNDIASQMFGYSSAEMRELTVEDLVAESVRAIHHVYRLGFLTNTRKRAMGYHPPISGVRKDGSVVDMAIGLTATLVDDDIMVVCTERVNFASNPMPENSRAELA